MIAIIVFGTTFVVTLVLFVILMATNQITNATGPIWIVCILTFLTPSVMEYADTNSSVVRYSRDGKLLAKTEGVVFCLQRCANVPDMIELTNATIPTAATASALGPLEISWQLTVRVRDWEHFAAIFATAKNPPRLYDTNTVPSLKQLVVDVIDQPQLEVERALHITIGFGNTSAAALGSTIITAIKPVLDQYGLEVVNITTTATLR